MSQPALRSRQLTVGYAGRRSCAVLQGVEVALEAGELIAVLGPNGAGKSTLLRTLAGMQLPLTGTVEIFGEPLAELTPQQRARRIGVVLPERVQVGLMTVFELVALGRHPFTGWQGRLRAEDRARVEQALAEVGLVTLAGRAVATLSDGERQKAMIARALAQEPTVLILDEPTAFLDLPGRLDILALLKRLAREGKEAGRSVLLSTHDLDLALRTADRVWLVHRGRVVSGAPEDLVLSGALQQAFAGDTVTFDDELGVFRVVAEARVGEILLDATGSLGMWTRRALERAGFRVQPLSSGSLEPMPDRVVRARAEADGEQRSWSVEEGGMVVELDSLADLLHHLSRSDQLG